VLTNLTEIAPFVRT